MSNDNLNSILKNILLAKENRVARQKQLLKSYKGTLVSFTINIPGPIKNSRKFTQIHEIGMRAFTSEMNKGKVVVINQELVEGVAGPTGFFNVDASPLNIKQIAVSIEETHPLGRLFDFDVLDQEGNAISRDFLNLKERCCLICNDTAATICRRNQSHSLDELLRKIDVMLEAYYFRFSLH